jgi:hypothetical protein
VESKQKDCVGKSEKTTGGLHTRSKNYFAAAGFGIVAKSLGKSFGGHCNWKSRPNVKEKQPTHIANIFAKKKHVNGLKN